MKKKITITNKFHNTATCVWAHDVDEDNNDLPKGCYQINHRQYAEMWKRVCGIFFCHCQIECTDAEGNAYNWWPVPAMNTIGYYLGNYEFTLREIEIS